MNESRERKADRAARDAEIIARHRRGESFVSIGADLGLTKQRVHQIWKKAVDETPAEDVQTYRRQQLGRLDALLVKANEVLERAHITVSHGQVISLDGEPLPDDGPVLQAIHAVLRIEERRAKLLGLDTPVEQRVAGNVDVRYTIVGVDPAAMT